MKSKTPKAYKNKKLSDANFGEFNLNDYQVFLQLISKLGKVDALGKYQQSTELERIHTITAKEFEALFNVPNAYPILKRAGTRMIQSFITLEKLELAETWQIAICSTAKYNHRAGSLTVEFNDKIMPYLAQVKSKFVLYNLKEISNFGSLYTTRLYELLQEFKDTGFVIKSIEQLRDYFAVGSKHALYKDFKRYTFAHAVAEINHHYDIDLTFEEVKNGRKVIAIKFIFKRTYARKMIDPMTGTQRNQYIKPARKAKSLSFSKRQLVSTSVDISKTPHESNHIVDQKIEIHVEESAIPTTTQLENSISSETDMTSQKESILPIDTPQPTVSNPSPQKKKKFFGLF